MTNGEEVYVKRLIVGSDEAGSLLPVEISRKFYPSFFDGTKINKFIVPIIPEYHDKLFTDFPGRQTFLIEQAGEFIVEGNTIKKAYLTHSPIKRMGPGDLILFYRSRDKKAITSLGVVELVETELNDREQVFRLVGKRTVFSREDIDKLVPVSVFLFRHHLHLKNPLKLDDLINTGILLGAPQSVTEISHEKYLDLKRMSGINEHLTIH
jgi:hypothetical protein